MELVRRADLEFGDEVQVERASIFGFCVDEERSAADVVGECDEAFERIHEECGAESTPFVVNVDAETSEERDGLRVTAATFAKALGRVAKADLCHAPCVVRDDFIGVDFGDDEYLGCSTGGGLSGVSLEPDCRFRGPASKGVDTVIGTEWCRPVVRGGHSAKGDGRENKDRTVGRSRAGRSLIASHAARA